MPYWNTGWFTGAAGELALQAFVDSRPGKFRGHADAVVDCAVVGRSMPDDADAARSQQRRAAVFAIVQPLFEFLQSLAREQCSCLRCHRLGERFAEQVADQPSQSL